METNLEKSSDLGNHVVFEEITKSCSSDEESHGFVLINNKVSYESGFIYAYKSLFGRRKFEFRKNYISD